MPTTLFTDAEQVCFDHDITIIRNIKTNISAHILIVFTKR